MIFFSIKCKKDNKWIKKLTKLIKQTMGVQSHIEMLRKKDNYSLEIYVPLCKVHDSLSNGY